MTTNEYLDAIQSRFNDCSDYRIAKIIGCLPSTISRYRAGKANFCDETALKVAELLEIPPGQVLADVAAERTKCPAARKAWREAARTLSGVAASVFIGVSVVFAALPSPAHAAPVAVKTAEHAVYYVKWILALAKSKTPILAGSRNFQSLLLKNKFTTFFYVCYFFRPF